jgi:ligand-binding SRPBCC domain-containing protein
MKFQHRFRVRASLAAVAEFHSQTASLSVLTPPPVIVRIHRAPTVQHVGDEVDFSMWFGPLPVRWLAQIEQVSDSGFVDRQVRGPFRAWVHRHSFALVDMATTEVIDEVQAELSSHWLWRIVGGGMWLTLPFLFAYRGWRTRHVLESTAP